MSIGLTYTDGLYICDPVLDEYGSEKIGRVEGVNCLFVSRKQFQHSSNRDEIDSDAVAYLDPSDDFLIEKDYQIQGMLVATGYGNDLGDKWYRIVNVHIAEDKLLNDEIEHIKIFLKKTTEIGYVS